MTSLLIMGIFALSAAVPYLGLCALLTWLVWGDKFGSHSHITLHGLPLYSAEAFLLGGLVHLLTIRLITKKPIKISLKEIPSYRGWIGLYSAGFLSALRGIFVYPIGNVLRDAALIYYSLFSHITPYLIRTEDRLKNLAFLLAGVVTVKTIVAFVDFHFGFDLMSFQPAAISLFMGCLLIVLLFTAPLWISGRQWWWFPISLLTMMEFMEYVVRSSWSAMIVVFIFYFYCLRRYRLALKRMCVLPMMTLFAVAIVSSVYLPRFHISIKNHLAGVMTSPQDKKLPVSPPLPVNIRPVAHALPAVTVPAIEKPPIQVVVPLPQEVPPAAPKTTFPEAKAIAQTLGTPPTPTKQVPVPVVISKAPVEVLTKVPTEVLKIEPLTPPPAPTPAPPESVTVVPNVQTTQRTPHKVPAVSHAKPVVSIPVAETEIPEPSPIVKKMKSFGLGLRSPNVLTRYIFWVEVIEEVFSADLPLFRFFLRDPYTMEPYFRAKMENNFGRFVLDGEIKSPVERWLSISPMLRLLDGVPFGKTFIPRRIFWWLIETTRYDPHNSHLAILYRTGLIGFVSYLLILIFSFARAFRYMRRASQEKVKLVMLSVMACCLFYLVHAMTDVAFENPYKGIPFWVLLGLLEAIPKIYDASE